MSNDTRTHAHQTTIETKLVLLIAIIAKGQPQKHHVQQQFNQLTLQPNRANPTAGQTNVEIVQEHIDVAKPVTPAFEPLKFPSSEEELPIALQQQQLQLDPSLLQHHQQQQQLQLAQQPQKQSVVLPFSDRVQHNAPKPMRIGTASAATVDHSKDKSDQFDYIRDFSWTLFQVNGVTLDAIRLTRWRLFVAIVAQFDAAWKIPNNLIAFNNYSLCERFLIFLLFFRMLCVWRCRNRKFHRPLAIW